jgi:RNA polymerase sigma-70 factor (ECF subfamily)
MPRSPQTAGTKLRLVHSESAEAGVSATSAAGASPPVDDHELLSALRSGDDAVATLFYHRVRPHVVATVGRMLGTRDQDFEDIVQVSLVELVRSIDTFRGECGLDSWVSRVTAYVVCKQIRRRRLERGLFAQAPTEVPDGGRAGHRLLARSLLERVRSHLEELDQDKALAFLLHDVCGFDLREAAHILGVSVAAAQKRLVRGRREVRERLAADPELAELLVQAEGERR